MKSLLRNTIFNALTLFLIAQIISGLIIEGGFWTHILGGLALSLLFFFLKPILNLLSLPLNALTLGAFSIITNVIIFYLLTVFVPAIKISEFVYEGFSYAGFTVPEISLNIFFAFIVVAFLQSFIFSFISWLTKK